MLEGLAYVGQILGGVGIFVAAITLLVHRNQLNFQIIASCTDRFQRIMSDLESEDQATRERAEKRYVDLCNEQLFYFRNGYLPRDVMEEWLGGMIDYLPLFDDVTGRVVHPERPPIVEPGLLEDYPRIKEAFTVEGPDIPKSPHQRKALTRRIGKKVRPEPVLLVLWRDILGHLSKPDG